MFTSSFSYLATKKKFLLLSLPTTSLKWFWYAFRTLSIILLYHIFHVIERLLFDCNVTIDYVNICGECMMQMKMTGMEPRIAQLPVYKMRILLFVMHARVNVSNINDKFSYFKCNVF